MKIFHKMLALMLVSLFSKQTTVFVGSGFYNVPEKAWTADIRAFLLGKVLKSEDTPLLVCQRKGSPLVQE